MTPALIAALIAVAAIAVTCLACVRPLLREHWRCSEMVAADDPAVRASDADRQRVVAGLQRQVGTGRLTLEEFSERAAAAYRTRTLGDLDLLTGDLPTPVAEPVRNSPRAGTVPVVVALAVLVLGVLLALAGPATADEMNQMMAAAGRMCG